LELRCIELRLRAEELHRLADALLVDVNLVSDDGGVSLIGTGASSYKGVSVHLEALLLALGLTSANLRRLSSALENMHARKQQTAASGGAAAGSSIGVQSASGPVSAMAPGSTERQG
jgi:hypothetical protein